MLILKQRDGITPKLLSMTAHIHLLKCFVMKTVLLSPLFYSMLFLSAEQQHICPVRGMLFPQASQLHLLIHVQK